MLVSLLFLLFSFQIVGNVISLKHICIFIPANVTDLTEKENAVVSYKFIPIRPEESYFSNLTFKFEVNDEKVLYIEEKGSVGKVITPDSHVFNGYIRLHAKFLGYAHVDILILQIDSSCEKKLTVSVIRKETLLSLCFKYFIIFFVIFNTFLFGCSVEKKHFDQIMQTPKPIFISSFCQVIIMPLIAFTLAHIFTLNASDTVGLFLVGCSPGGGASNLWAYVLGGDLMLSIILTFINSVIVFGTMPFWFWSLGRFIIPDSLDLKAPFFRLFLSLSYATIPPLLGVTFRYFLPKLAVKLTKTIKMFTTIVLLAALILGISANLYIFKLFTLKRVLAGLSLPWSGFLLAFLVAYTLHCKYEYIVTVVIETGLQNSGIAILIFLQVFPQPLADLSIIVPVIISLMTPIPLLLALITKKSLGMVKSRAKRNEVYNVSTCEKKENVENELMKYKEDNHDECEKKSLADSLR